MDNLDRYKDMNLSTEGMNIIEVQQELFKLRRMAHDSKLDASVKACNICLKIIGNMIADNAIKNVKF